MNRVAFLLALGLGYYCSALLGWAMASMGGVAVVSPAAGVALGALYAWGMGIWPVLFVADLLANQVGTTLAWPNILHSLSNTLGPALGAVALKALSKRETEPFGCVRNAFVFIAVSVLSAASVSAVGGVCKLELNGVLLASQRLDTWLKMFTSDAIGALVVTPALLTWVRSAGRIRLRLFTTVEPLSILAVVLAIAWTLFAHQHHELMAGWPLALAFFPCMLWAAIRTPTVVLVSLIPLVAGLALTGTINGLGPFGVMYFRHSVDSVQPLQLYLGVMAGASLMFHAVVREWEQTKDSLRVSQNALEYANDALERRVIERTAELAAANEQLIQEMDERQRVEETLRERSEFIEQVIDHLPSGLAVFRLSGGEALHINPRAVEICGVERSAISTLSLFLERLYPNENDRRKALEKIQAPVVQSARSFSNGWSNVVLAGREGDDVHVSVLHVPVPSQGLVISVFNDVTRQHEAEENSRKLEAQLRQAQKMEAVGQLAGGVAHDFNNLLQIIIGHLSLLMSASGLNDGMQRRLRQMREASDRAAVLVRQLLTFSRNMPVRPRRLDLNDVVTGLLKMLRRLIGEHIELDVRCGSDLRPVLADRGEIEQVLMNLCVNARDAMADGGTISINLRNVYLDRDYCSRYADVAEGYYVIISVADTGTGMTPEVRERIFEPFFTTKEVGKGTGLGLATVYGIVKRINGQIRVYSELGKGSVFHIYLPADVTGFDAESEEPAPAPARGGHETILLAEDEALVRELATETLTGAGYRVLVAADGDEAVHLFKQNASQIQMALLDVVMPKRSGRAVAQIIHELRPDLPVLFCSGYTSGALSGGQPIDDRDLILKPFVPLELLTRIREMLDQKQVAPDGCMAEAPR